MATTEADRTPTFVVETFPASQHSGEGVYPRAAATKVETITLSPQMYGEEGVYPRVDTTGMTDAEAAMAVAMRGRAAASLASVTAALAAEMSTPVIL